MVLSMSATSVGERIVPLEDAFGVFQEGIKRTLEEPTHYGMIADDPATGEDFILAAVDGLEIAITVDSDRDRISAARYDGEPTPAERAVLKQLCVFALGASPRELVEHGLIFVVERLRDPDAPRPVEGILGPRSAGPCFQRPRQLLRALRGAVLAARGAFEGDNVFDRPYSDTWLTLPAAEKIERLEALIQDYREQTDLDPTAMAVFEIDQYDRVVVIFDDGVPVWDKPPHLLALERWLRQETGERIEVFVETVKDSNRIRRL